mmetsp:Transcript_49592/g.114945  ORF Transcript_49592/g.114945 Transcript_49592/m.114945 type:complete len:279 (+) Transcript_49592:65-901(+)|eukprot:CAMPEP_0171070408 /NCGR_PEP_ID=MMETSP0766_2-20121228/9723_1 /TAXON_ID=439317 /ORGANISM="Gambierdiscus australes, Strain CAWD 149" /LENGTH=278 /DNA_ID=CAMNT_0011526877 /DNA_START=46 /DNA_END=882 /DNA_ORIENTATION=+
MERLTESTLAALGPVALVAKERSHIEELGVCTSQGSVGLKYSEEYDIDIAKLYKLTAALRVAVVVVSAVGSSDLWLNQEHGPSTRLLCESLRGRGIKLRFVVRVTTDVARTRWSVDSGRGVPDVFEGFRTGDATVIVWEPTRSGGAATSTALASSTALVVHDLAVVSRAVVARSAFVARQPVLIRPGIAVAVSSAALVGAIVLSCLWRQIAVLEERDAERGALIEVLAATSAEQAAAIAAQGARIAAQDEKIEGLQRKTAGMLAILQSTLSNALALLL